MLDDGAYGADRGLFFRSIHGTLNHLLTADRPWFRRITGEVEGEAPTVLDQVLHDERDGLLVVRPERSLPERSDPSHHR